MNLAFPLFNHNTTRIAMILLLLCISFVPIVPQVTASEPAYTITDIGVSSHDGIFAQLNNQGHVAVSVFGGGSERVVLWTPENGSRELNIPIAGNYFDMNDSDQIVGRMVTPDGNRHAFLYENGAVNNLGTLPGSTNPVALGVNNNSEVVGTSHFNDGFHMFLYTNENGMQDLSSENFLPPGELSVSGINIAKQIAGTGAVEDDGYYKAFLYHNGAGLSLGTLGGRSSGSSDLNEAGHVTGYASTVTSIGERDHAFLYRNGTMLDLGTLSGSESVQSYGYGINNKDEVVGESYFGDSLYEEDLLGPYAFLWISQQGMVDLNTLLPENSGWELTRADDINDEGQIVGIGYLQGEKRVFLLTPAAAEPEPNQPPSVSAGPNAQTSTSELLELNGIVTDDGKPNPPGSLTVQWSKLSGSGDVVFTNPNNKTTTVSFDKVGTYVLRLTASDGELVRDDEVTVTVLGKCSLPTIPRPSDRIVTGSGWGMFVSVTDNDGIAVKDVILDTRYMAKEMSVPYFNLQTSAFAKQRLQLTPNGNQTAGRSRLVDFAIDSSNPDQLLITGKYMVDNIPDGSDSCVEIEQRYEFNKQYDPVEVPEHACEPSSSLPCARFRPMLNYTFHGEDNETLTKINTAHRVQFAIDYQNVGDVNTSGIFQDCEVDPLQCLITFQSFIFSKKLNPVPQERLGTIILNGSAGEWDNFHQTYKDEASEPHPDLFLKGHPGCPECIHMHWRWGLVTLNTPGGTGHAFMQGNGNGNIIFPQGHTTTQTVQMGLAAARDTEKDPENFITLLNSESLIGKPIVMWYSAESSQDEDTFFWHGGTFSALTPVKVGNNIDLTLQDEHTGFSPVTLNFENVIVRGTASVYSTHEGAPAPPNFKIIGDHQVYYEIKTTAKFTGGIDVCINYENDGIGDVDPLSLNLFHWEDGKWVNRTVTRVPNQPVICALVNSLSPFAIFKHEYSFEGFFSPIDNIPTLNGVKAGSAIPVKFSLNGNQGLDIFASGYPKSHQIACDTNAPLSDVETTVTAGSSSLSYDAGSDQYSYVWKSDKAWSNTCRQLVIKLDDTTEYIAKFKFK